MLLNNIVTFLKKIDCYEVSSNCELLKNQYKVITYKNNVALIEFLEEFTFDLISDDEIFTLSYKIGEQVQVSLNETGEVLLEGMAIAFIVEQNELYKENSGIEIREVDFIENELTLENYRKNLLDKHLKEFDQN